MAVLDRKIYKETEKMLCKYFELKRMYKEKREEIMFGKINNIRVGAESIGYHSDPTATTVIRLLSKELKTIENWIKVIEKVRGKFAGTDKGKLLEMQYFEELGPEHIQSKLYIERRTYYMWRNDIVLFTVLLAQKYGLIDVEKEEVKKV
jgi:RinA family phage transcriptional activator